MGKFVISSAKTGFKFNLLAGNGEIIATSQVYKTKASCKVGIKSVIKNAGVEIENQTEKDYEPLKNPKYEVYKDKKGEFRFRLKSSNGQIVAVGEGYKDLSGVKNGIASVKKNASGEPKIVDETAAK
ncbi:MAG TPA: hypothetical protein DEO40_00880 [Treponema sp.]|jgi:uncharacterized protein YegP (UPF0339 family)|nr:hypothetical protein [Treponema sp.]